jgi:ABC-type polar amino acid transport system ATPase subunit
MPPYSAAHQSEIRQLARVKEQIYVRITSRIIGPSGSGKATLLRCVNLLLEPDRGEVLIGVI